MAFTSSFGFPLTIGGCISAGAIAAEALGVVSNNSAACLLMPGMLLLLDASTGTQVLNYYFFAKHPFTQEQVEALYFARSTSFPRYAMAVVLSAAFAVIVVAVRSEMAIAVGLVGVAVAYSLLAGASLVRCILQARRQVQ